MRWPVLLAGNLRGATHSGASRHDRFRLQREERPLDQVGRFARCCGYRAGDTYCAADLDFEPDILSRHSDDLGAEIHSQAVRRMAGTLGASPPPLFSALR